MTTTLLETWQAEKAEPDGRAFRALVTATAKVSRLTVAPACGGGRTAEEAEYHARLAAAAPALLDAIKGLLQHCVTVGGFPEYGKGRTPEQQAAYDAARAAIAKAEGRGS